MTEGQGMKSLADESALLSEIETWIGSIAATGAAWYFDAPHWTLPILFYGMLMLGYAKRSLDGIAFQV